MNHHGNKKGRLDSVINSFFAGTRSDVSDRIHRASIALLASVCLSAAGPRVHLRWRQVPMNLEQASAAAATYAVPKWLAA